jgi:hypothetical protein
MQPGPAGGSVPAVKCSIVATLVVLVAMLGGRADAYPQYQLSRDQMCTSCHLSPAGGGLLTENGLNTADVLSQWGTDPAFLNGAIKPPSWLTLGGDFRAMGGYVRTPQQYLEAFPMQGDLYGTATKENFSVHATVGFRPAQFGNEMATRVYAREHYIQLQTEDGLAEGMFVRIGRLMPVFGLRLAEHPVYTRRFGGTPLFSETYGATASYIKEGYEAHASGFIRDPLMDGVRLENGAAIYGEARLRQTTQLGAGAMFEMNDSHRRYRGTVTAKQFFPTPGITVLGELQLVVPKAAGERWNQLVGYVMGSYSLTDAVMIDLGVGYFNENLSTQNIARYNTDLNVHWFVSSHFEAMLVTRYEQIGITGTGGNFGGYSMLQAHYRL